MEVDVEMRQPTVTASAVAAVNEEPVSSLSNQNVLRPSRPSSPDFPSHPSPDMPPWLVKCLKLLALHTPEAGEELGRMMDEALERRIKADDAIAAGNAVPKIIPIPKAAGSGKIPAIPAVKKSEFPVKNKLVSQKSEGSSPKRPKFSPSSTPVPIGMKSASESGGASSVASALDDDASVEVLVSGTSGDPADDAEVETDLSALLGEDDCTVCGEMTPSAGNVLLKCYDCKKIYHQLCHKPSMADVNPDDPRFVFYCQDCQKKQRKPAEKSETRSQQAKIVPVPLHPSKPKTSAALTLTSSSSSSQLFKRAETKPTAASSISASGAGAGLAKLAKTAKQHRSEKDPKKIKLIDPQTPPPKKG